MIRFSEALDIMLNSVDAADGEIVSLINSTGRILFEDIYSNLDIPPFNNSAMDGYAIIAEDTKSCSIDSPIKLNITGEIQAGIINNDKRVTSGNTIEIMTGASMPAGADSVIPVEDTKKDGQHVLILKEIKKKQNVRFAGEDISKGQKVLQKGNIIKSADTGLLASLGVKNLKVYKQLKVAVISTGDEIVDIDDEIKPGQIRNSNAYTLIAELKKYNAIPEYLGIAKDTIEDTKNKLIEALNYDMVITTGGVSMGKYDYVKDILKSLGVEVKIDKISVKPGKPLVFGKKNKKLFFGLPGNPVSTMTSFMEFVRPVLLKTMGAVKIDKPLINAILDNNINKKKGRVNLIRGYFTIKNGTFYVSTTGPQGSGILSSMSDANCLIIIPEELETIKAGENIQIQLINHEEI